MYDPHKDSNDLLAFHRYIKKWYSVEPSLPSIPDRPAAPSTPATLAAMVKGFAIAGALLAFTYGLFVSGSAVGASILALKAAAIGGMIGAAFFVIARIFRAIVAVLDVVFKWALIGGGILAGLYFLAYVR